MFKFFFKTIFALINNLFSELHLGCEHRCKRNHESVRYYHLDFTKVGTGEQILM
jgi:hypothetical protein